MIYWRRNLWLDRNSWPYDDAMMSPDSFDFFDLTWSIGS